MIKKLLLIFSFVSLLTIAFDGITYATHESEPEKTVNISEELTKLNDLYKEGVITEEEFSKAKSILLKDPPKKKKKKEKWWQKAEKKEKLTAAERRDLEELKKEELETITKVKKHVEKKEKLTAAERRDLEILEMEGLTAEKKAELEKRREERKRKKEEAKLAKQACENDPDIKCPSTILRTLKKINIFKKD